MLTMQAFHNHLFAPVTTRDRYFAWLARLTHASLKQLATLKSAPAWGEWD